MRISHFFEYLLQLIIYCNEMLLLRWIMVDEDKKISLPKELQIKMLDFFMKTSIPRKLREKNNSSIKK